MGTIRVRTTAAAVGIVGVALAGGSIALVTVLGDRLTDGVRAAARLRADEVAALVKSSQGPERPLGAGDAGPERPLGAGDAGPERPFGAGDTGPVTLAVEDEEDQVIQVVDRSGNVLASSRNVAGRPPVARLRPGESTEIAAPVDEGDFLAVARAADLPQGEVTVIVGRTLSDVAESTQVLTRLLLLGLPLLLVVVGFTTWKVVGRALAPVEAMRREVDEISAAELHRRVPQPAGGDEISRLASTMNRMLGRLEDSQARQRRFVSDASHELRSPVASIRQHAEVALAHPDRSNVADLAETVLAEDLRVQRLVEDLLLLARADERSRWTGPGRPTRAGGTGHPGPEQPFAAGAGVDLDDLVFDEARRMREGYAAHLEVVTTGVSAGRVGGDPDQLRRMIRNLVDNASRHARSRIVISLGEQEDGFVLLRVEDDGAGIPPDERDRVFERFVRLDDARASDDGGSGLGLAIVAEVVAVHGGTVRVSDSPGGGALFEVALPRQAE